MVDQVMTPDDGAVWITGASSGIGRQVALEYARRGWRVVATARSADALAGLAGEGEGLAGRIEPAAGDVADEARMAAIVAEIERTGPIALAILNAGVYLPVRAGALATEPFRRSFDVNLMGTVNALVPVLTPMIARRKGHVALVSSVTGYFGMPTSAAYGATKAALINMAESLKFDLDNLGVRISVINPGFVDTPATEKNAFAMPFLVPVEAAATRIVEGLARPGFELTFPRRFTYALKVINHLPYRAYFALIARATGWRGKTD